MNRLHEIESESEAGELLRSVMELDSAVTNYKVDWGDITAEQEVGLKILREERSKYTTEQHKKQMNKHH